MIKNCRLKIEKYIELWEEMSYRMLGKRMMGDMM
jgi:hypothetical protein